ncbi:hypothetical protein [Streptomyces sp. R44]|uniref:Twin-arginine translocation signal domain-containing protein n=1 Tax=Streptomyces sp. R44 TaxID=3238633 RepID=A0AB39SR55_9ACTN
MGRRQALQVVSAAVGAAVAGAGTRVLTRDARLVAAAIEDVTRRAGR